jgi:transposase
MNSIGLDISKSTINVYIPINDSDIVINNDSKGIKGLYAKLKKHYKKEIDKLVFVFEPTGNYSFLLKQFCANKHIQAFIVNPKKSANFAKVMGHRNKTDIQDAKLLSKMLVTAKQKEVKVPVINNDEEELKELISYYRFLIKQQVQTANHKESLKTKDTNKYTIEELESQYEFLKQKQKNLIKKIKTIIYQNSQLKEAFLNIQSIQGLGEISSIVLLSHFIQYPNANQREIVSLAGLDPIQKSSGSSINGKVRISKAGSKLCRSILFMPAMSAAMHNHKIKAFYERLKENGKHTTVAQVAVMRKFIIIAHSLYKNNEEYDPNKI